MRPLVNRPVVGKTLRLLEACRYLDPMVWRPEACNHSIRDALLSSEPIAVGKLGSVEMFALKKYLMYRDSPSAADLTAVNRQILFTNAGVFPNEYPTLERYARLMTEKVLPHMSHTVVWFNFGEARIVKKYCPEAKLLGMGSLAPFLWQDAWTKALAGKKVLVVHPFCGTILRQYPRRRLIWGEHADRVLPDFELDVLPVPLSPALVPPVYTDWFAVLDALQLEMSSRDFDIALVGCGAYSLPLVVHARNLGRQGIHLGGGTQILFGIRGGRWDKMPEYNRYYNEHWIRPLPEDTPQNTNIIEGGCYW